MSTFGSSIPPDQFDTTQDIPFPDSYSLDEQASANMDASSHEPLADINQPMQMPVFDARQAVRMVQSTPMPEIPAGNYIPGAPTQEQLNAARSTMTGQYAPNYMPTEKAPEAMAGGNESAFDMAWNEATGQEKMVEEPQPTFEQQFGRAPSPSEMLGRVAGGEETQGISESTFLGIPVGLYRNNADAATVLERRNIAEALRTGNTKNISDYLNSQRYALPQGNLSKIGNAIARGMERTSSSLNSTLVGLPSGAISSLTGGEWGVDTFQRTMDYAKWVESDANGRPVNADTTIGQHVLDLVEFLPMLAMQTGAAIAAAPVGLATLAYAATGAGYIAGSKLNESYAQYKQAGMSDAQATNNALLDSAIAGGTMFVVEQLGGRLMGMGANPSVQAAIKQTAARAFASGTVNGIAVQGGQMGAQHLASEFLINLRRTGMPEFKQFYEQNPDWVHGVLRDAVHAAISGMEMGLVTGGVHGLQARKQNIRYAEAVQNAVSVLPENHYIRRLVDSDTMSLRDVGTVMEFLTKKSEQTVKVLKDDITAQRKIGAGLDYSHLTNEQLQNVVLTGNDGSVTAKLSGVTPESRFANLDFTVHPSMAADELVRRGAIEGTLEPEFGARSLLEAPKRGIGGPEQTRIDIAIDPMDQYPTATNIQEWVDSNPLAAERIANGEQPISRRQMELLAGRSFEGNSAEFRSKIKNDIGHELRMLKIHSDIESGTELQRQNDESRRNAASDAIKMLTDLSGPELNRVTFGMAPSTARLISEEMGSMYREAHGVGPQTIEELMREEVRPTEHARVRQELTLRDAMNQVGGEHAVRPILEEGLRQRTRERSEAAAAREADVAQRTKVGTARGAINAATEAFVEKLENLAESTDAHGNTQSGTELAKYRLERWKSDHAEAREAWMVLSKLYSDAGFSPESARNAITERLGKNALSSLLETTTSSEHPFEHPSESALLETARQQRVDARTTELIEDARAEAIRTIEREDAQAAEDPNYVVSREHAIDGLLTDMDDETVRDVAVVAASGTALGVELANRLDKDLHAKDLVSQVDAAARARVDAEGNPEARLRGKIDNLRRGMDRSGTTAGPTRTQVKDAAQLLHEEAVSSQQKQFSDEMSSLQQQRQDAEVRRAGLEREAFAGKNGNTLKRRRPKTAEEKALEEQISAIDLKIGSLQMKINEFAQEAGQVIEDQINPPVDVRPNEAFPTASMAERQQTIINGRRQIAELNGLDPQDVRMRFDDGNTTLTANERRAVDFGKKFGVTVVIVSADTPIATRGAHSNGVVFLNSNLLNNPAALFAVAMHETFHAIARQSPEIWKNLYATIKSKAPKAMREIAKTYFNKRQAQIEVSAVRSAALEIFHDETNEAQRDTLLWLIRNGEGEAISRLRGAIPSQIADALNEQTLFDVDPTAREEVMKRFNDLTGKYRRRGELPTLEELQEEEVSNMAELLLDSTSFYAVMDERGNFDPAKLEKLAATRTGARAMAGLASIAYDLLTAVGVPAKLRGMNKAQAERMRKFTGADPRELSNPATRRAIARLLGETLSEVMKARTGRTEIDGVEAAPMSREQMNREIPSLAQSIDESPLQSLDDVREMAARVAKNPRFSRWFGESEATDKQGRPLVLFHGTKSEADFDAFEPGNRRGQFGRGIYLASTPEVADWFAGTKTNFLDQVTTAREGGRVYPLYASIRNPFEYKSFGTRGSFEYNVWKASGMSEDEFRHGKDNESSNGEFVTSVLKKLGYDGVVARGVGRDGSDYWVAFDSNQVKSAIGNNGEYSAEKPQFGQSIDIEAISPGANKPVFKSLPTDPKEVKTVIRDASRIMTATAVDMVAGGASKRDLIGFGNMLLESARLAGANDKQLSVLGKQIADGIAAANKQRATLGGIGETPTGKIIEDLHPELVVASGLKKAKRGESATAIEPLVPKTLGVDPKRSLQMLDMAISRNLAAPNGDAARGMFATEEGQIKFWREMLGTDTVPKPFQPMIEYVKDPKVLGDLIGNASEEAIRGAIAGRHLRSEIRDLITNGKFGTRESTLLSMWGIMSAQLSPYQHEAAALKIMTTPSIKEMVAKAIENPADFHNNFSKYVKEVMVPAIKRDAETGEPVLDENGNEIPLFKKNGKPEMERSFEIVDDVFRTGDGDPGNGAKSNFNRFIGTFMYKMSEPLPGDPSKSYLDVMSEIFGERDANGNLTTAKHARRRMVSELPGAIGMDLKIMSFLLLLSGREDAFVFDRVQWMHMSDTFDSDISAYGGGKTPDNKKYGGYSKLKGVPMLAMYEQMEAALGAIAKPAYEHARTLSSGSKFADQLTDSHATPGDIHWMTWNAQSFQDATHASLDYLLRTANGQQETTGIASLQGKFGALDYGARYSIVQPRPDMAPTAMIEFPWNNKVYRMSLEQFSAARSAFSTEAGFKQLPGYQEGDVYPLKKLRDYANAKAKSMDRRSAYRGGAFDQVVFPELNRKKWYDLTDESGKPLVSNADKSAISSILDRFSTGSIAPEVGRVGTEGASSTRISQSIGDIDYSSSNYEPANDAEVERMIDQSIDRDFGDHKLAQSFEDIYDNIAQFGRRMAQDDVADDSITIKGREKDVSPIWKWVASPLNLAVASKNKDVIGVVEDMIDMDMKRTLLTNSRTEEAKGVWATIPKEERNEEEFSKYMDEYHDPATIDSDPAFSGKSQAWKDALKWFKNRDETRRLQIVDTRREAIRRMIERDNSDMLIEKAANLGLNWEAVRTSRGQKVMQTDAGLLTMSQARDELAKRMIPDNWGRQYAHFFHWFNGEYKLMGFKADGTREILGSANNESDAFDKLYAHKLANPGEFETYTAEPVRFSNPDEIVRMSTAQRSRLEKMLSDATGAYRSEVADAMRGIVGTKAGKRPFYAPLMERTGAKGFETDFMKVWAMSERLHNRWLMGGEMVRNLTPRIEEIRAKTPGWGDYLTESMNHTMFTRQTATEQAVDSIVKSIPVIGKMTSPFFTRRWLGAARGANYWRQLFTVRQTVINSFQPIQTVYPILGEKNMVKAVAFYNSPEGKAVLDRHGSFGADGRFREGTESILGTDVHDFVSTMNSRLYKATGEKFNLSSEARNQNFAFAAMYWHGINNLGMNDAEAARYGRVYGNVYTQFHYTKANLPMMMRGPVASTALQYRRFMINSLGLMVNEFQKGNYTGAGRYLATMSMLGGIQATVGLSVIGLLRSMYLGDKEGADDLSFKMREWLKTELGSEKAADIAMMGLPAAIGIDMSGSISITQKPFGRNLYEKIGATVAGPTVNTVMQIATNLGAETVVPMSSGERIGRALLDSSPAVQQIVNGWKAFNGDNQYYDSTGRLMYKIDPYDAWMKTLAFRTVSESVWQMEYQRLRIIRNEVDAYTNQAATQIAGKDLAGARETIRKFNSMYPMAAITMKDVQDRAKNKMRATQMPQLDRRVDVETGVKARAIAKSEGIGTNR